MTTREYWRKRAEEIALIQSRYADLLEREIMAEYEKAIDSIQKDIELFYARYASNEGVTMAQARKQLDKSQLQGFRMALEEFMEKARSNADGRWEKELENEYVRSRVSRLEALKSQLAHEITALGYMQEKLTERAMNLTYSDTFYRTIYEVGREGRFALDFSQLNVDAVKQAVTRKWIDGGNFSDRIWRDKEKLLREMNTNLVQGIIRGDSVNTMIKNLSKRMNVSKNNAAALVQTETAHIMNEAAFDSYHELDVSQYDVLGTLDLHTCSVCGSMDGKSFQVSQREIGVNAPPFHTRCRCTTVPHFADMSSSTRAARDIKTDKTVQVDYMTFEEWKKQLDIEYGEGYYETARKKVVNRTADKEQYQRYRPVLGSDIVGSSFDKWQEMKYNDKERYHGLKKWFRYEGNPYLQNQLAYTLFNGEKDFIPNKSIISSVKTIAGAGSKTELRIEQKLVNDFGGDLGEWCKRVGKIESAKYIFDVHWYELNGIQYRMKLKNRSDKK